MAEHPAVGVPRVDIDKFALSFPLVLVGSLQNIWAWPASHSALAWATLQK